MSYLVVVAKQGGDLVFLFYGYHMGTFDTMELFAKLSETLVLIGPSSERFKLGEPH